MIKELLSLLRNPSIIIQGPLMGRNMSRMVAEVKFKDVAWKTCPICNDGNVRPRQDTITGKYSRNATCSICGQSYLFSEVPEPKRATSAVLKKSKIKEKSEEDKKSLKSISCFKEPQ